MTYVDNEVESVRQIAKSFEPYLAGLVDETAESALRLYGDVTPKDVMRRLAKQLGVAAPDLDPTGDGHPTYRLALPGKCEWCWGSRNRVPAGFRRRGAKIVVTKKTALRVPEDPDCAVLLQWTAESEGLVTAALTALGIPASEPAGRARRGRK